VLKARVRGVKGTADASGILFISLSLPAEGVDAEAALSCRSSDASFWVARSSGVGIMDQMPKRRLRRKTNLWIGC
jgi:hypothetical protein